MLDLDAPPRTYLDLLRDELRTYEARRDAAIDHLAADQPEYLAKVLAMWDHAIGVKRAQIAREEERCSPD